jgi:hypothetical protein
MQIQIPGPWTTDIDVGQCDFPAAAIGTKF